jgi:hypothetical protein
MCTGLQNYSVKPKINEKLLLCVKQINSFECRMGSEADAVFSTIGPALEIVVKREMGVVTQEKEFVASISAILANKENKSLSVGLIVTLLLSVWVCIVRYFGNCI